MIDDVDLVVLKMPFGIVLQYRRTTRFGNLCRPDEYMVSGKHEDVLRQLGRWAINNELTFDWKDAAKCSVAVVESLR